MQFYGNEQMPLRLDRINEPHQNSRIQNSVWHQPPDPPPNPTKKLKETTPGILNAPIL